MKKLEVQVEGGRRVGRGSASGQITQSQVFYRQPPSAQVL